jgi:NADP-dependent 3-hydroxy acid dehydrogenase YdfG
LLARRADRIQVLAEELGDGAIAIQSDVTDYDSVAAAAARVKAELGSADVLVNNAGIMLLAPFTPRGHADHRRMVEANLLGAMNVTEVFLDQLRDGGGDLVNLSSVAGRTARRVTPSMRRPSGASTDGRNRCARSCSPISGSWSSSPAPSRLS